MSIEKIIKKIIKEESEQTARINADDFKDILNYSGWVKKKISFFPSKNFLVNIKWNINSSFILCKKKFHNYFLSSKSTLAVIRILY